MVQPSVLIALDLSIYIAHLSSSELSLFYHSAFCPSQIMQYLFPCSDLSQSPYISPSCHIHFLCLTCHLPWYRIMCDVYTDYWECGHVYRTRDYACPRAGRCGPINYLRGVTVPGNCGAAGCMSPPSSDRHHRRHWLSLSLAAPGCLLLSFGS